MSWRACLSWLSAITEMVLFKVMSYWKQMTYFCSRAFLTMAHLLFIHTLSNKMAFRCWDSFRIIVNKILAHTGYSIRIFWGPRFQIRCLFVLFSLFYIYPLSLYISFIDWAYVLLCQLYKGAGEDVLQLFDLSVIPKTHSTDDDDSNCRSLMNKGRRDSLFSLGTLLYRVAHRLSLSKVPKSLYCGFAIINMCWLCIFHVLL